MTFALCWPGSVPHDAYRLPTTTADRGGRVLLDGGSAAVCRGAGVRWSRRLLQAGRTVPYAGRARVLRAGIARGRAQRAGDRSWPALERSLALVLGGTAGLLRLPRPGPAARA